MRYVEYASEEHITIVFGHQNSVLANRNCKSLIFVRTIWHNHLFSKLFCSEHNGRVRCLLALEFVVRRALGRNLYMNLSTNSYSSLTSWSTSLSIRERKSAARCPYPSHTESDSLANQTLESNGQISLWGLVVVSSSARGCGR